ncbi:MAG TPA: hypothetical protein ENJ63_02610 [Dissulfuribacter thermophilus]|uniref:Uncharacterized protein n=1 Tax=Dissulfuribacter thermophilus TaxID=1156395 RepID=A0A7V2SYL9_9BACT|nr:hypothetical protein [Dissulfuribacter thermophilus]
MASKIDDITIRYEDTEGNEVVRELDKEVLSRGAWTTIMFLYEELDPRTQEFTGPKVTIRRYKKVRGDFRQQSKFNISSSKQALTIAETLKKWFSNEEGDS